MRSGGKKSRRGEEEEVRREGETKVCGGKLEDRYGGEEERTK